MEFIPGNTYHKLTNLHGQIDCMVLDLCPKDGTWILCRFGSYKLFNDKFILIDPSPLNNGKNQLFIIPAAGWFLGSAIPCLS